MRRDLERLANDVYDVVVIGGGISGVWIAWDAALRGLRVALVERGDFGGATSANSMKTVHGGLRYLQDGDLRLIRRMILERSAFLRIAPHLARPLAFVMPTTHHLMRSRSAMRAALKLNDLIGFDRNRTLHPLRRLPDSRILSRAECLELLPGLPAEGVTGGAVWYDAQVHNTERLLLSVILSAVERGAAVANYVTVTDFLRKQDRVIGVKAQDTSSGQELDIRARVVVNAAGAWIDSLLRALGKPQPIRFPLSTAVNLVTRQVIPEYAAAVRSNYVTAEGKRSNQLILAPWREYSIVGTFHSLYEGHPDEYRVTQADIEHYLGEANSAYPGAELKPDDVRWVHYGFVPAVPNGKGRVEFVRRARVHDHQREDGIEGLISAVGVKYTTARHLAEQVVDLTFAKLHEKSPPCRTAHTPVRGGDMGHLWDCYERADALTRHLLDTYGSDYTRIQRYFGENPDWKTPLSSTCAVTQAEVVHAAREEMAQTLADVVLRRTELGSAGLPDDDSLRTCAQIMARELNWSPACVEEEIHAVVQSRTKVTA